jgi:hypothetical protein
MNDDDFDRLGRMVDRLDNAATAATMNLPDHIHRAALRDIVESIRDDLKALLRDRGFDPWSDE